MTAPITPTITTPTDPTTTPTPTATPVPTTEVETPHPNHEAANYRTQLRAAEAQRDAFSGQLDATRRALAEHALTAGVDIDGHTLRPTIVGDVFDLAGVDVGGLYAEDGTLDLDALAEAARGLHATRPALFEPVNRPIIGPYVPSEGSAPSGTLGTPAWAGAFEPKQ